MTLKDHKPDFQTRPSVRLINQTKQEIGRILTNEKNKSLVDREIHKNYRKETTKNVEKVNKEHGTTVRELELDDKVLRLSPGMLL